MHAGRGSPVHPDIGTTCGTEAVALLTLEVRRATVGAGGGDISLPLMPPNLGLPFRNAPL